LEKVAACVKKRRGLREPTRKLFAGVEPSIKKVKTIDVEKANVISANNSTKKTKIILYPNFIDVPSTLTHHQSKKSLKVFQN
jgi:hypothetical protein